MLGWPAVAAAASILTQGRRGRSGSRALEVPGAADCLLSMGSAAPPCPASVSGACPGSGTATGAAGSATRRRPGKIHRGCGGSRRKSRAQGTTRAASPGSASERGQGPPGCL